MASAESCLFIMVPAILTGTIFILLWNLPFLLAEEVQWKDPLRPIRNRGGFSYRTKEEEEGEK